MKRRAAMEYFAGLDVSMEETHVSVVDRDGKVILEARTPTAPKTIAAALAKGPAVEHVLFETGRMAPMLFHGLTGRCHVVEIWMQVRRVPQLKSCRGNDFAPRLHG